jgi:rubrerythrin
MSAPHESLEAFYAHALAIEREAVARYTEFAAYFSGRGEAVLGALCDMLARMETEHYAQLARAAEGLALPPVSASDYGWSGETAAEGGERKDFYRIRDAEQLLEIALEGEVRAHRFFAWIADAATDPALRAMAREMAAEEHRHIRWVTDAITFRKPLRA